jgi:hypothetical protein
MSEIKIFCLHCGQHIECDEGYRGMQITCPTCNQSFLVPTGQTQTRASIPPRPAPAQNTPTIPALWNPQAAAYWSLIFSPIFGSYLHAKNAVTLGRREEAKRNRVWFYGSIVFLASIAALSFFTSGAPSYLGLAFFCSWYYDVATKQIKYVKKDLGNNYQKKSWTKPLLIPLGVYGCIIACVVLAAFSPEQLQLAVPKNEVGITGTLYVKLKSAENVRLSMVTVAAYDEQYLTERGTPVALEVAQAEVNLKFGLNAIKNSWYGAICTAQTDIDGKFQLRFPHAGNVAFFAFAKRQTPSWNEPYLFFKRMKFDDTGDYTIEINNNDDTISDYTSDWDDEYKTVKFNETSDFIWQRDMLVRIMRANYGLQYSP